MSNKNETSKAAKTEALNIADVICRWKFFYEDEEDSWYFFIDAKDHEEAYDKAYETHGPQVADMMYYNVVTNGI